VGEGGVRGGADAREQSGIGGRRAREERDEAGL
jgi:hypothetical protein